METFRALHDLASVEVSPCVTLYLNTPAEDADARERARRFVRRRLERALLAVDDPETRADLEKVLEEARRRLEPPTSSRAVAIFACGRAGIFRALELGAPVDDELVIGDGPALRQLALLSDRYEHTLVILVSADEARIFDVVLEGPIETESVESAPVNRLRSASVSPGWMQTHYQQRVREQIERHLREVAQRTVELVDRIQPDRIVVGGPHPTVDRLLHELPARVRTRVVDLVALPPEAAVTDVVHAARAAMEESLQSRSADVVQETIALALSGGPAALGVEEVCEGLREHRLMTLVLDAGFSERGTRCHHCRALFREEETCLYCSAPCDPVDLGEALVRGAIAQDALVEQIPSSEALSKFGGVAAKLRW